MYLVELGVERESNRIDMVRIREVGESRIVGMVR